MTDTSTPETGRFENKILSLPVRVYYEDTDFSGVVYHANYLKFFERGRTEYLRAMGMRHSELAAGDDPGAFVVARMELDFKRPARIDDALLIETRISKMRGPRVFFDQRALRGEELICAASVMVVAISMDGRPRRLSAEDAARWQAHIIDPDS
ncbi:MAG: tol-pal system-associated acyl-CoA thioesterase [Hirschia sp.]|nr:tol-pal system-associated acyl-CoA thioesterase [Hirschia sp.]MBF19366.1 tol-pal system-associated acyl-CoA thioesterase [Hirschia sp.]|tara:strand:+ start:1170 stop:1628 length:459 start_codon:yes stop_codon:yes gene_type:complete